MDHPAITRDRVAVITGAASGIGLAAAQALAARGMRVCLADRDEDKLEQGLATIEGTAISHTTDVADLDSVLALRQRVLDEFGEVALLMNNAGTGAATGSWTELSNWQRIIGVNFWGVVHGLQTFTQQMIDQGTPCAIINTGSKQGITNPPGSPAYNASKAGVKSVTESLAHELRNTEGCQVTAHLLVPGFTYTGMISRFVPEQPPAAWRPEQVVERLLDKIGAGDFYVICPDNDVNEAMDNARMRWNVEDMTLNRSALSRWDPAFETEFSDFMSGLED